MNDIGSLAMRWNGRGWNEIPDPGNGGGEEGLNSFNGVDVVSKRDVWVMRAVSLASWDGRRWGGFAVRNRTSGLLFGIAAVGPRDVWGVGYDDDGPVVVDWNGRATSVVYTPFQHLDGDLSGLSVLSLKDLWAVGNRLVARYSCS